MKNLRIEIKWAIIFTIITLIWMVFEKSMGWHDELINKHAIYTNLFAIIAIATYVILLIDKRKNFFGGQMSWRQGFMAGLFTSIFIAILTPLTQYLIHNHISPDFFKNSIDYSVSTDRMSLEKANNYFNPTSWMIQATFGALGMGIITSAIVALILKKGPTKVEP